MNAYGSTDGAVSTETGRKGSLCAEPAVGPCMSCALTSVKCAEQLPGGGGGWEEKEIGGGRRRRSSLQAVLYIINYVLLCVQRPEQEGLSSASQFWQLHVNVWLGGQRLHREGHPPSPGARKWLFYPFSGLQQLMRGMRQVKVEREGGGGWPADSSCQLEQRTSLHFHPDSSHQAEQIERRRGGPWGGGQMSCYPTCMWKRTELVWPHSGSYVCLPSEVCHLQAESSWCDSGLRVKPLPALIQGQLLLLSQRETIRGGGRPSGQEVLYWLLTVSQSGLKT